METIYQVLDELQEEGVITNVEVGWRRKSQIKEMKEGLDKLKNTDKHKYELFKRLSHFYFIVDKIPDVPIDSVVLDEEDKYGWGEFHDYLDDTVDTIQRTVVGIITSFANDKKIDKFYRYIMHPGRELKKEMEDEEVADLNLGKYEVRGGGASDDGIKYITLLSEDTDDKRANIPVPLNLDEKWYEDMKRINPGSVEL